MAAPPSPIPPALFNRALAIWQEFGPERGKPVETRWADRLPALPPADYDAVAQRCRAVERRAYDLAVAVLDGRMEEGGAMAALADAFPELDRERVSRTWNQARYFSIK